MSGCAVCRLHKDKEGDIICLQAAKAVDEINEALDFIDDYDNMQCHTQRWRVSDYEDDFDVVDLLSDSEEGISVEMNKKVETEVRSVDSSEKLMDVNEKVLETSKAEKGIADFSGKSNRVVETEIGSDIHPPPEVISISSSSDIELFPCSSNRWIEEGNKENKEKESGSGKQEKNKNEAVPSTFLHSELSSRILKSQGKCSLCYVIYFCF